MFYHGSKNDLPIDTVLESTEDDGYTSYEECISIENAFEYYKPFDKISRKTAIYLVDNPECIEKVGGYEDYIYKVEPEGNVEKSDLYWYNMVSKEMGDFFEVEEITKQAQKYIENYWLGVESNNPTIEYRINKGVVTEEIELKDSLNKEIQLFLDNKKPKNINTDKNKRKSSF